MRLSADVVPVHEYLAEQVADVTIHTWDLARAIGTDEELDDALVEAVWGVFEPQKDALEACGPVRLARARSRTTPRCASACSR